MRQNKEETLIPIRNENQMPQFKTEFKNQFLFSLHFAMDNSL